ncbi:Iron-sulfur clusters transporter atm1 [Binucleata daphniae]
MSNFKVDKNNEQLCYLSVFVLTSIVYRFVSSFTEFILVPKIQSAYRKASRDSFRYFISLNHTTFTKIGSGEIHATVERSSKAISDILRILILDTFPILVSILFYSFKIGFRMGFLSAFILWFSFIIFFYTTIVITKKRNKLRLEVNKRVNYQSNALYDTLTNYDIVLAYNNKELEVQRYDEKLSQCEILYSKIYQALYVLNFVQRLIIIFQIFFVILLGLYGLYNDSFTNENYMFYMLAVGSLTEATYKVGHLYKKYITAIQNLKVSYHIETDNFATRKVTFNKKIVFENVRIFYDTNIILQDLNFEILKGEKIAFVGKNGMGKSTILNTILGFADYNGYIKFDDNDYFSIDKNSVRDLISYIHQDNMLFNDTVLYNIMYGKIQATKKEVIDVCKKIGVHESFEKLSNGYDTVVGERGMFLSGGERQKVAFARAALKNGEILMLDEPTANLDQEAENIILDNIMTNFGDKTMIMIVHNLNLLDKFDKIVYIGEQTVLEVGSFDQLIDRKGLFYNFYTETVQ